MKKPLQLKQVLAALLTIAALASGLTAQATVQAGIQMQGLTRTVNNVTMCSFVIQSEWGGDQIPAQTGSSYTFSNARMIHGTANVTLNGTLNFQVGTAFADVITATSFTVTIESSSLWFYGATVQTKSGTNVTGCTVTTSSNHNTLTVTIPSGKTFGAVILDYVSNPPMTNSNTTVTVPQGNYWVSNSNHKPKPEPTVVYGGQTTLVKDTDYTLSWSNNSSAGTGTVTVTGIGNYAGSATGFFYIRWAIYYVHFDKNHDDATGTISDQVFIYNTAQALTDNTFSRTGYSFDGWSTTSNGAVTYTDGQSVNNLTAEDGQTVTLYAQWVPITYNISYDLAGGSVTTANPTTYNIETATFTLNNPTRTGYTFAGWTGSNGTTPQTTVTINQGSIGDRSYTANWTPITYNISYDLAGGSVATANPTSYTVTAPTFTLNNPTKEGYTFAGWTGSNGTTPQTTVTIAQGSIGNRSYTANWTPITYDITYDLDGGSVATANPTSYNIETETFTLNNPTKTGYTFDGWTGTDLTEATQTVTITQGSMGDRSYTANWTLITYNITYDLDGGSVVTANPTTYNITTNDFTLNNPTKTGYTFAGWTGTDLTEATQTVTIAQGSIGDRSYTANWTLITYNLTYDLDGGSVAMANPTSYNVTTNTFTLNNPTKTGYTFAGWTGTDLTEATQTVTIAQGSIGDRSYTANWTLITYNLTYDLDGGSVAMANPTTYDVTTNTFTLNNPTKTGYTFAGWTGTDLTEATQTVTIAQGSTGDLSYTAHWTIITYNIAYDLNGGSVATDNPVTYTVETPSFTLINPTRPHFTFAGWAGTDFVDPTTTVTIEQGSTGDRNYYANWTPNFSEFWGNGDGSQEYPYIIIDTIGLNMLATLVNEGYDLGDNKTYFELGADIQYDNTVDNNYKCIGNGEGGDHSFSEVFDGKGYTISGIRMLSSRLAQGLFGWSWGGTVKNVILTDAIFSGSGYYAGGIVGYNQGTVENCLVIDVTVGGNGDHGAVVGVNDQGTVTNSYYRNCTVGSESNLSNAHIVTAGDYVTASIEDYSAGIEYDGTLYAPVDAIVSLNLGNSAPAGILFDHYIASAGTLTGTENPYSLTMPAEDVTINATLKVPYIDADGNQQTCTDFTIIESSENNVNLGTSGLDVWYVVSGDVTINGRLSLSGINCHLILCDGATLNINHTNNADGLRSNNLIIYGQSVDNGTLTASAPWNGIHTNNNLTINGGIISATSTTTSAISVGNGITINRGSITAHGHYDGMRGQNVIINGGIVNATNGEGSNSYGINANYDITLGYTELTDRITASSYKSFNGTISVKAGQTLYDGTVAAYSGTLNSTQIDAIAGKTLEPCFILTLPELVNATGVISQEDTTAYALAGAEITLAAVEGYEITDGTTSFTMPAQNVVSDVTVQIITYNITYDLDGGSVATANPTTYNIETATFTLNNPNRQGYTFAGWTGTDLDEPTMTVTIAQGSTGDRSYTATWSTDAYTITYDLAGGSVATANPTTYNIETETFILNNPTRQGYTFAGWTGTDLDEPTMNVTIAQGSTGDRSYTATWSLLPVTYIDADGVEQTLYDYTLLEGSDEFITYGVDNTKAWYVVAHDVTYNGGVRFYGSANLILEDGTTLTVRRISAGYNYLLCDTDLTIYVQSGGTGAIVGENIELKSNGSMTIHGGQISVEKGGWDGIRASSNLTINGGVVSVTMTADGTAIYSEHVVINGGVVTTTNQQGYGIYGNNEVTINGGVVTTTNQQGYGIYGYYEVTINGGLVTANATEGAYGISVEYSYRTITLGWTNATDRITSDSYYGTVTVATGQAFVDEAGNYYLSTLTDSQVAAMSGQTLIPFTDFDMPFAITYETNGGTLPSGYPATYTFAETVTLPIPTNEDNFFLGWYDNAAFDGYPITEITAGTSLGDKTFYAYWLPKYTDVTYLDADGQPQTVRAKVLYGGDNTGEYEYECEGGVYTILAKSDYWVFYDLLRFTGDATLILPDEGELVIGVTKGATDEEYGLFVDGNLTIFGQEMGSGTLFLGSINAEGNVNIYGGQIRCWSVIASNDGNGTITLSWTSPYNYIFSPEYSGTVVLAKDFITDDYNAESPIIIPAGQVSDIATINGKSLYPYIETMDVSYIDENGATHTVNARVLYGGETTLDGGYYTYLGEGVYFRQTLSFDGNTTLIIPDDSYLYIDDWYNSGHIEGNGIAVDGNLSIYGQAGLDGHIDISATVSVYATGDVTVSNVDFSDRPYTTNGILCGGDILIAGGWFYSFGILNANDGNGTITLGYLTEGDAIQAYDYEGTVVIREGQTMQDWYDGIYSGTLTSEEVANIAGQDLVPYIEPITLTVEGYGESNGGWVFIASPMLKDVKPTEVGNIFSSTEYDLYRFDQSQTDEEWQNFVALPNSLVNGQGYLYASKETVELIFHGVANPASSEELTLNAGWNLVGNPFASDATLDREYYVMNQDGTGINPEPIPFTTPIPPCTAVFVKAETDGETVVFSRVTE